ncbi:MAG: cadherin repeat domain-containing protein [Eubacterium sp.]|nr:cadherin repeat domain-containing protein [Eubacterium sp.]
MKVKKAIKKYVKSSLVFTLAIAIAIGFIPLASSPITADEEDPAIILGTGLLAKNANKDGAQTVWYGGRDWSVIAYDGKDGDDNEITYQDPDGNTENLHPEGAVALLQNDTYEDSIFNETNDWAREWFQAYGADYDGVPSELRTNVEKRYLIDDDAVFSDKEKKGILSRTLPGYGWAWDWDPSTYDSNRIYANDLDDALVWPLSHAEADVLADSIKVREGKFYWLRTPGWRSGETFAVKYGAIMEDNGIVNRTYYTTYTNNIRPAFYLDEKAVLMTSAAYSGKVSGKTGPTSLKKVTENTDNEWKITLKDESCGFKIDSVPTEMTCKEELTLQYSEATTGTNEYISAIITDKDGNITYYGKLKDCSDDADDCGDVTVNLKNKYSDGDKLYIFNEQMNGDEKTDYSSELKEITVPTIKHTLNKTDAKDPTCTDSGNTAYWTCSDCGLFFGDADGKTEIEKDSWVIPAKGHKPVPGVHSAATLTKNGFDTEVCSVCGAQTSSTTIYHPETYRLARTVYAYTGLDIKPEVTVIDANGNVIAPENYDVNYMYNVNIGTAKVKVTFISDNYEGTKEGITFTIVKGNNTLAIRGKTAKVKYKKLKKKAQKLKVSKFIKIVNRGQGKLTYRLTAAKKGRKSYKKYFKINSSTGKLTIKRKRKKGTYNLTMQVYAAGNVNRNASGWKTVNFKIKVK